MRRPGNSTTRELFSEAARHGDIKIRPARSSKSKRPSPFSIRFTECEREQLEAAAGNLALGVYIKLRLFDDLPPVPRQNSLSRVDKEALGKVLGAIGESKLASNMNQIARAANIGTLPVDQDLVDELYAACGEIKALREAILGCIGVRGRS
jgi:RNase P/RNase MRP subunit POP5